MPAAPLAEPPVKSPGRVQRVRRFAVRALPWGVVLLLSFVVVRTYVRTYDPQDGWTRMICFGSDFAKGELPRLRETAHYVPPGPDGKSGYDGQFYAQLALDPSLRSRAFDSALDTPTYRARRIGLPLIAFCLGCGVPAWILQAYALSNLLFWYVLLGALCALLKPLGARELLCVSAAALCSGAIASMERSLVDLPSAALIFAGLAAGSWTRFSLLAAAILTRETSVLAAPGLLDLRRGWREGGWQRPLAGLALAVAPFAGWLLYVHFRFGHLGATTGEGNFAIPLQAMCARFGEAMQHCSDLGLGRLFRKPWRLRWLYLDHDLHDLWTIAALCVQGAYLLVRRGLHSPSWRIGVCFLVLGCTLGPAVWEDTSAAARVLLPLTVCFYLRLARERPAWFWPFFVLGTVSVPYGIYEFWQWS